MARSGVNLIETSIALPREILIFGKKLDRAISATLGRAGDLVVRDMKDVMEFSRTTGRLNKQIKRSKVGRIGTRKFVDIAVDGDREKVSKFLEWGTSGGVPSMKVLNELRLWMDKKGIGRGRPERERRAILFYIWREVTQQGIEDRHYFRITRRAVEPKVQLMFAEMIKRLLTKLQAEGALDGTGD